MYWDLLLRNVQDKHFVCVHVLMIPDIIRPDITLCGFCWVFAIVKLSNIAFICAIPAKLQMILLFLVFRIDSQFYFQYIRVVYLSHFQVVIRCRHFQCVTNSCSPDRVAR